MAEKKSTGVKSAYELALERLERDGIERPRQERYSEEDRRRIAEVRSKAEADLAQAEIMHHKRLRGLADPQQRQQEEQDYLLERRRIEAERDRELEKLRQG